MTHLVIGLVVIGGGGALCTAAVQAAWQAWQRNEYEEGR